jgi:hypothetical protein
MPHDVTVHAGKAYIAALGPSTFGGNVSQYDALSGGHTGGVTFPTPPCSLTGGSYGVWIAGCPDVYELGVDGSNVATGRKVTIPYPPTSARQTPARDWAAWRWAKAGSG